MNDPDVRVPLGSLTIGPRDEYIAEVMAFLIERGYSIIAPGGVLLTGEKR